MGRRDQAGTRIRGTGKEGGKETDTEGEEGYRDNATASGAGESGRRAGLWATDHASGDDHGPGERGRSDGAVWRDGDAAGLCYSASAGGFSGLRGVALVPR